MFYMPKLVYLLSSDLKMHVLYTILMYFLWYQLGDYAQT